MARICNIVLVGIFLALGAVQPSAGAGGQVMKLAMREKLSNSQGLLEALVAADHTSITRYAGRLSRISETEIASWQESAQPDYVHQATVFLMAVEELNEAAGRQDIGAAATAYTTMVSSCIRCHQHVRTRRMASVDDAAWLRIAALAAHRPPDAGRPEF
jgi:hypothetical protein